MTVGIYYGSTTGNTESVANIIGKSFDEQQVTVCNVASSSADDLKGYDLLILGSSTWGYGELQDDWGAFMNSLDAVDLSGCKVAIFGVGDLVGWGDTFVDAMGIINEKVAELGAEVVGQWPVDGYEFADSKAVVDGKFAGLALDETNQPEKTDERIDSWVELLKKECCNN